MLRKNILANLNNIKNKLSERDSLLPNKVSGNRGYKDTNGIPLAILDNKTRGNKVDSHVGDKFTFMKGYNEGTIDEYDKKSNGVGIVMGSYGMIWFDANALLDL